MYVYVRILFGYWHPGNQCFEIIKYDHLSIIRCFFPSYCVKDYYMQILIFIGENKKKWNKHCKFNQNTTTIFVSAGFATWLCLVHYCTVEIPRWWYVVLSRKRNTVTWNREQRLRNKEQTYYYFFPLKYILSVIDTLNARFIRVHVYNNDRNCFISSCILS